MKTAPLFCAITLAGLLPGCARLQTPATHGAPGPELAFSKHDLTLRSGGVIYDLLNAVPVRSARIYDLLSQETFTRRYFVVEAEGRRYALKTEQREGAAYPCKIVVETRRGFRLVQLDGQGNVVRTDPTTDLSE